MSAGVVVFDPATFKLRFAQFAAVSDALLQMFFEEAALNCNNSPRSRVRDLGERSVLLNLITAHIATLSGVTASGGAGSTATQVGRVSSASEGSVSASLDMGTQSKGAAYWMQTQYGAQYWQISARYRTMSYIPPRRC